jgi:DNA-binding YbaB/EbfC family protein
MNIGKMMKDLQKMQAKMQQDIDALEIEGSAGGGVVTVRMNGKKQLTSLSLAPEAITPDDSELMEDLILAAVNEAGRQVDERIEQMTQGLTAGLNLPGGLPKF